MKSIGAVFKEERIRKKLSKEKLEKLTKIKKEFIEAIEKQDWNKLPEYPVVVGFVKNISGALRLNEAHLLALLRRDYPPKDLRINPKEEVEEKFTWSPRLTFILAVSIVILGILGYLLYQYYKFIQPPELFVEVPLENQVVNEKILTVKGRTNPQASVLVNNQPTIVEEDGSFTAEIEIFEGTKEVSVIAKSRSGKETTVSRKIIPELGE